MLKQILGTIFWTVCSFSELFTIGQCNMFAISTQDHGVIHEGGSLTYWADVF